MVDEQRQIAVGLDPLGEGRPDDRLARGADDARFRALAELLDAAERYARCSRESRAAALAFIAPNKVDAFAELLVERGAG